MSTFEIRDPDLARGILLQGMLLARVTKVSSQTLRAALNWAAEIVGEGNPLPIMGLVSDIGQLGQQGADMRGLHTAARPAGVEAGTLRRYEDYVLGKLLADFTIERGLDALERYAGRDRDRATAYMVSRIADRSKLNGTLINAAVIKTLLSHSDQELDGLIDETRAEPVDESLVEEFGESINRIRNTGELLGSEDVFELERGTAISRFGQRLALRQVLQAMEQIGRAIPKRRPRGMGRQYPVATNILEEDYYPIGGFTSISNRGTVESLLRSELAYIDDGERPDLFDIKWVRDELLYYSRDENQFFRRRLCFMFVLQDDLSQARVKDETAQWQRIVYVLGALLAAVDALKEWLSHDAIRFEFLFLGEQELQDEQLLLETILHDDIEAGFSSVERIAKDELSVRCESNARQSLCHCTLVTGSPIRRPKTPQTNAGKQDAMPAEPSAHAWLLHEELEHEADEVGRALPLFTTLSAGESLPCVEFDDQLREFTEDDLPWNAMVQQLFEVWL